MQRDDKIFVAGPQGMVGAALVRALLQRGFRNLVLRTSKELDLTRQTAVEKFFLKERPIYVFLAAARVGGIYANQTFPAEFITTNLQIETNVIHAAWRAEVQKLLFFSSSCVYPRLCSQPMKEEYLWTGPLEPTNESYAVGKLAGMALCRAYRAQYSARFFAVIPTNLYGPNDNYDPQQSHVMAALISKFHVAKVQGAGAVTLWGTGTPRRELMFVDDAAEASLLLMEQYDEAEPINIGLGTDVSIFELAAVVKGVVGYKGAIVFDASKPDGAPQKLLDVSRIQRVGWKPKTDLYSGIQAAYEWYLQTQSTLIPLERKSS